MRVALISSLTSATGNAVTAQRLADHLRLGGEHTVELWDIKDLDRCSGEEVKERLARERVDAVLAIHAWRAGRHLLLSSVPFVLVFGGTDLNEHAQQSGKLATMTNVVRSASFVVAFSTTMEQKALSVGFNLIAIPSLV
ncbi:Glycosyltransferase 1 domain-containing protein 1 [Balamuthia mandrillaris]